MYAKTSLTSINLIGFENVLVRITLSLLLYISVYCNKHFGQKAEYVKFRTSPIEMHSFTKPIKNQLLLNIMHTR